MRYETIPSTQVTSKTLRAQDYVYCPNLKADQVIIDWLDDTGLRGTLVRSGSVMKDLRAKIEEELVEAMKHTAT